MLTSRNESSVIEVYPAVTLKQNGLQFDGYKGAKGIDARQEILNGLLGKIQIDKVDVQEVVQDDNILHAVVCVLAGMDCVDGLCVVMPDKSHMDTVLREGWIWFRAASGIDKQSTRDKNKAHGRKP